MPVIRQLPPDLVAQIAAGEVVERPASVVKELLENAVDAGATRIDIDLEQGGTELIRVVDDGCGMAAADLPLAFAAHATSKLASSADLFAIRTLGFRGEALASIAGVASVTLQSRRRESDTGSEIRCDRSALSDVRPWGGSPGTRIEVRRLFDNVPARKKFLKAQATELGHVSEAVTRLALSHPGLHLTLRHNGKLAFEVPGSAGLADRVGLFFGGDVQDAVYELDSGPGEVRVSGLIVDPKVDRGNPKLQYLFVNGRWFRDRSIGHALQEAYRGLLMTGRYAIGFLYLEVPPDSVDVNVHPQKFEVRFRENSLIYSLVRSAVKARLLKANLVPQLRVPEQPATEHRDAPLPSQSWLSPPPVPTPTLFGPRRELAEATTAPWDVPERLVRTFTPTVPVTAAPPEMPPAFPRMTPEVVLPMKVEPPAVPEPVEAPGVAVPFPLSALPALASGSALQVHDSYIVLETPDGMMVIDQHALHERILYEQLRRRLRDGTLEVQRLLIPEAIDLPADQAAAVLDAADDLAALGLEVSDFGGNTVLLGSYPTLLSRRAPHVILSGVIDHLMNKERAPTKEALFDHLLATMACKAAVKAGDRLTQDEIAHLLMLRQLADDSHHCPHGRPTSLLFSRQHLDRQFGRV